MTFLCIYEREFYLKSLNCFLTVFQVIVHDKILIFLLGVLLLRLWRCSCRSNGSRWPSWVRQKQKEEKEEEGLEKQNYNHPPRADNPRAYYNDWIPNNDSVSDFEILKYFLWNRNLFLFTLNPSAAGPRDLRLLQAATKILQLDKMRFLGYSWVK